MDQIENSRFSTVVSVIAVCGFGLLAAMTLPLWSRGNIAWLEHLEVWLSPKKETSVNSGSSAQPIPETAVVAWSEAEIKAALMECVQSVAPLTADLEPIAPIRRGECGNPAPVLLRSIGSRDRVALDPPLVMNCPMVVALHRWLEEAVQPAAREEFGSPVSRIIGSTYACRSVYNLPNGHLSQHAFANALDLPMFVLADRRKVDLTRGWGPTQRDLIAETNTKRISLAARKTDSQKKTDSGNNVSATDVVKVSTSQVPNAGETEAQGKAPVADLPASAEAKFLRIVQKRACAIFSTVLGPEANDEHRTHLHLDLQDRKSLNVCK
jgi:hypothetical protein